MKRELSDIPKWHKTNHVYELNWGGKGGREQLHLLDLKPRLNPEETPFELWKHWADIYSGGVSSSTLSIFTCSGITAVF